MAKTKRRGRTIVLKPTKSRFKATIEVGKEWRIPTVSLENLLKQRLPDRRHEIL